MSTMLRPGRLLALGLPILGIVAMIARAELTVQSGAAWRVRIGGYDPRDPLRGHYLVYRLNWNLQGDAACSGGRDCCYCLWDTRPAAVSERASGSDDPRDIPEPAVSVSACPAPPQCQSAFGADQLDGLQKYYIPEDQGTPLEKALREREASLVIAVSRRGKAAIRELLLDGEPWREALQHPPKPR